MAIPRAVAVVTDGARVLVIKRFRRNASSAACVMCQESNHTGPDCPGHSYAVLPGGRVEDGESAEAAAVRELREESTLEARIDHLLWTGLHNGRAAYYFLMTEVTGTPLRSGPEAQAHGPNNSYELAWATAAELDGLNLYPAGARDWLRGLIGPLSLNPPI